MEILDRLRGVIGVAVLLGIAWALSNNRRKIPWRVLAWGLGLQVGFALLILKTAPGETVFDFARRAAARLLSFSDAGASFLFGNLYKGIESSPPGHEGWSLSLIDPGSQNPIQIGVVVAFHVLPVIIFFSSLMAVLYHYGVMQRIVQGFAFVMRRAMGISGAESLSVAANVFVGMVEAPLAVRPYLSAMTVSELATVMTAGFATVAGSVMASYIRFGVDAGHLLAASVMSAPAAVVIAKLMYPESDRPKTMEGAAIQVDKTSVNGIDAAANGAVQGLKVAAIVGAMLIAFLSIIAMLNYLLGLLGNAFDLEGGLSLGRIFGWLFSPLAWCMGVEWEDVPEVGRLLGTKVAVNEFVGYLDLVSLGDQITERSRAIATYALCGFANFGSVAILIGGVGSVAPDRRSDLARLGLRTMLGGALATWLTAAIAGMMI
jgi:CNT family concentrative nucleoside transporter